MLYIRIWREVIASVVHTYLIRVKKSRRRCMSSNGQSKRKCWYTYQSSDEEHPSPCEAACCVGTDDTSSTEIQLFTHHDIVKQYRKGLTAVVVDVYSKYPTIGTTVCSEKFYSLLFCSGRDSCMLTSRCMLPWLRSVLVETRAC